MATQQVTVIARPGKIATDNVVITMHAVTNEQHTLTNTITDHPVEEGFNASDHSRPEPDRVTMECWISNTPLSSTQTTQAVQQGDFTFQTTATSASGAIGATDGYAQSQWSRLRDLREQGTLVTLSTTMGDYQSMAIESISLPRTARDYDAIHFNITFKRIRVVQNKLTRNVPSTDTRVGKKKATGNKTTKEAEAADTDPLRKVKDGLSGAANSLLKGFSGTSP